MASVPHLLRPKWTTFLRPSQGSAARSPLAILFFGLLGVAFWWGVYKGSYWLCEKCLGIEDIGELLLQKILSMAFLTFFSILIFSNLITAFSTFFLSDDLQLLCSSPIPPTRFFGARFFETLLNSSWMIVVFGCPLLLAYGQTFGAGPSYYLQLLVVFPAFLLIPTSLAILVALLLATAFPARRMRDLILFLFVIAFAALYIYFRILQPERFLTPEQFSQAVDFLGMLRNPTSAYLPSDWAVSSLFPFLSDKHSQFQPIHLMALYSTSFSLTIMAFWCHEWFYSDAFSKAQMGRKLRVQGTRILDLLIRVMTWPFSTLYRSILTKEFRVFVRNPGQWAQLLLLGALVVVYVFNFSSLRQISSLRLHGVPALFASLGIYLFNLLLLGFVVSAVAVRFAFPSVSLEGRCFWLIKQSPITMIEFLETKFWSVFLPLTFLAELMTFATNLFIRASWTHTALAVFVVILMTTGITGAGIGLGALYPRFNEENPAKIATGFGGVLYMICSIVWVLFLLMLLLLPLRHLLWSQARGVPLPYSHIFQMILCAMLAFLGTYALYRIPMKLGAKALEARE